MRYDNCTNLMNIIMFIALSRSLQSKEVWFDDIIGILI